MRQTNKRILEDLKDRFVDGAKLTTVEIINKYFSPKSPYAYLVAQRKARQIVQYLKNWFRNNEGLWFGALDDAGRYGIVSTEEEVRFALTGYYKFVKGNIKNASLLVRNATDNNLLPAGMQTERLLVAKVVEEEDENSSN